MPAPPSVGAQCPQVNVRSCWRFQASLLYSAMMSYFKITPFCPTLFLPPIFGVWGRKISPYSPLPRWTYHLSQTWPFQFHIHSFKKKKNLFWDIIHTIKSNLLKGTFQWFSVYSQNIPSLPPKFRRFLSPPKRNPIPVNSHSSPYSVPGTTNLSVSMDLSIWTFCINGIIQ